MSFRRWEVQNKKKKKKEETEMTLIAAEGRLACGACMQVCAFDPFISSVIVIIIICDQFPPPPPPPPGGRKKKREPFLNGCRK